MAILTIGRKRSLRVAAGLLLGLVCVALPGRAQLPLGPDFQVNVSTARDQTFPHVAADSAGRYVVSWDNVFEGPDLTGLRSVRSRLFDGNAKPRSAELVVAADTAQYPNFSAVAVDATGRFLVVWAGDSEKATRDVFGRLHSPMGQPLGEPIRINAYTPGNQIPNGVAPSESGFVVVWGSRKLGGPDQDGSDYGVFGRRILSTGELAGSEFQANTYTPGSQFPSGVAALADNDFVVVWSSSEQDGSGQGIFGQRLTGAGDLAGSEFQVNQYSTSHQYPASVASDSQGNFVVVWASAYQDTSDYGVFARLYDAQGHARGDEFQINTNTFFRQALPQVASDSAGNFVVVWENYSVGGPGMGIRGRAFRADGQPASGEFQVNSYTSNWQRIPDVALSDSGTFVVVWQSFAQDGDGYGVFGRRFASPFPSQCVPSETTLCLGGGRFRVEARWRARSGFEGSGRAIPLSGSSGAFWFFGEENLELLVKTLDGCGLNDRFWVFAAGLTNVEVDLTVIDSATAAVRTYRNPRGTPYAPLLDTEAFATCAAAAAAGSLSAQGGQALAEHTVPAARGGACQPAPERLCLRDGRFELEAAWSLAGGRTGPGRALPLTAGTGAFWFFREENLELLVKVLDGCTLNGRFWLFAGGLTNVAVELTLRDTTTGAVATYRNPLGRPFVPIQDTAAFATCP
jgi:hypothetical protein